MTPARRALAPLAAVAVAFVACGPARPPVLAGDDGCAGLAKEACGRAQGLLTAASAFSNVRTEYILDPTSSFAHGRGLTKGSEGLWKALPTQCAKPTAAAAGGRSVDASTIDFGFVGVAVDDTLLATDADITPFFSAGAQGGVHKVRLVAIAFVRDLDPQFFDATDEVAYESDACTCRGASHFVGAVKMGGLLSYDLTVREGEVHGKALDFFKARLATKDVTIVETRVGGLEVDGLESQLSKDAAPKPLGFHVKSPVPIAYAVYPIADVCKFAFPEPEVSPVPLDFGDAPYGKEATRLVHVVNRASFDLVATLGKRTVDVPARGTADVPVTWVPMGDAPGCELQSREDSMVLTPKASGAPVVPRQHSIRLPQSVRTGRGTVVQADHVDTGEARRPDYSATARDWTCPPDRVVAGCRTQSAQCGDKNRDCTSEGYTLVAEPRGNGCHFGCTGPTSILTASNWCRFDAVMECRLACDAKK